MPPGQGKLRKRAIGRVVRSISISSAMWPEIDAAIERAVSTDRTMNDSRYFAEAAYERAKKDNAKAAKAVPQTHDGDTEVSPS